MAFLPENLENVQEPKAAPAGTYELQITAAEQHFSGENAKHPGAENIRVSLGFTDQPNVPNIRHFISLPYGPEDESADFKLLMLKRFLSLFQVPYTPDTDSIRMNMLGATAMVEVGVTEPNDNGDIFNTIQIPRMRNEPRRSR